MVDEYRGAGAYTGKGNREAYLARCSGWRSLRQADVEGSVQDTLTTASDRGPDGSCTWHVNPSTRPVVEDRQVETLSGTPVQEKT